MLPRLDIITIVTDLNAKGYTDDQIRKACGIKSKSAVSAWRNGDKRPSLLPGLRLIMLHARHFPERSPLRQAA